MLLLAMDFSCMMHCQVLLIATHIFIDRFMSFTQSVTFNYEDNNYDLLVIFIVLEYSVNVGKCLAKVTNAHHGKILHSLLLCDGYVFSFCVFLDTHVRQQGLYT